MQSSTGVHEAHYAVLASILEQIVQLDTEYAERNQLLWRAVGVASMAGVEVGIRLDPGEPAWPVLLIELPTGQVSWHLPQHVKPWDGHTTAEKFARVRQFAGEHGLIRV